MSPKLARRSGLAMVVAAHSHGSTDSPATVYEPATYDFQENCPVIFANLICLGAGRTGRTRVTFYDSSQRAA